MKLLNLFDDYIQKIEKNNLHPKMDNIIEQLPNDDKDLMNIILYGDTGIGKYTQSLNIIKKYSQSNLKYEKKMIVISNKEEYFFKISDIHFEIDLNLLGCNAKILFNDIYNQIIDVISSRNNKKGIILCKNFHNIHPDLLDSFYSYMQTQYDYINISYIIISESISFISDNILNNCLILSLAKPSKSIYKKCIPEINSKINIDDIENIKDIIIGNTKLNKNYKFFCDKLIHFIINYELINFLEIRENIYNLFTYKMNINNCIFYILEVLFKKNKIPFHHLSNIITETIKFFKYFNNNYRPIYHLEKYILNIIILIHEL